MVFDLGFLNVATKANTRGGVGTAAGGAKKVISRSYDNLTFSVKKGKIKKIVDGNEITVDVLKGVFKFSKNFFDKAKIDTHTIGINYASDPTTKQVFIYTVEGEGSSCNYNAGKSKDGKKSQEFRSNVLEEMLQEGGILPAELVENFRQGLTLNKLDVETSGNIYEVFEVVIAKEGDGDVEESDDSEEAGTLEDFEIGDISESLEETEEDAVAEAEADDFM
jgi:hypothetical protein